MYVSKLGNNADQYAIVEDGTGRTLAVTHSDQSGANAALFSAAPDLQKQLDAFVTFANEWFGDKMPEDWKGRCICANAAIAKAST